MQPKVETVLAVQALYARYAHAIDSGRGNDWASCYTEDGVYSSSSFGESRGRSDLAEFATDHYRRWIEQGIQTRHWNNQMLLEMDGTGLRGTTYVLLTGAKAGEQPQLYLQTVYSDTLVRVADGEWRLARRESNADAQPNFQTIGFDRWAPSE